MKISSSFSKSLVKEERLSDPVRRVYEYGKDVRHLTSGSRGVVIKGRDPKIGFKEEG